MQSNQLDYLPIVMQAGLAIGFVVLTIIGSSFLGPKRHSKIKTKISNAELNQSEMLEYRFR